MFDPEVLQILGLNLMSQRSPNFGEALGNAGLATMQYQRQREEDKYRKEEREFLKQQREMQMAQMKREQQFRDALGQAVRPGIAADPLTPMDDEGNRMPSSKPSMDFSQAMAIDPLAALQAQAQFAQLNQPKTVKLSKGEAVFGADGRRLFDNPEQMKPEKPKFVAGDTRSYNSGGMTYTQEFDGKEWKTIAKSPQWKPESGEQGMKPPPGYQWAPDGSRLSPIPGGPADYKVGKEAEAAAARQKGGLQRAQSVIASIDQALDKTNALTAGSLGAILGNVAGTKAYDLRAQVKEIKSNIGFQELQAMREASPTGGALGQVAVQELDMLQSVLGSIDPNQSPTQLVQALTKVRRHFKNYSDALKASQQQQPNIDDLVRQYGGK